MPKTKRAFLFDVNGVLYVGKDAIPGAIETIRLLREKDIPFRLVSNATQSCAETQRQKLTKRGFDIRPEEIYSAPIATIEHIKRTDKSRAFLISTGDVYKDFLSVGIELTDNDPDFVVVGDAGKEYTYKNMNLAFNLIRSGAEFLAMEKDTCWMTEDGLVLSAGPYVAALEYATGRKATLLGKPSKEFFLSAIKDMGSDLKSTIMVGDDVYTDVQGAQKAGIKAYLVQTGKYDKKTVSESGIKPDRIIESIAEIKKLI